MKKLLLAFFALFFTGCASFNYKVVGWYNDDTSVLNNKIVFSGGKVANIVGNPHIVCYTKRGVFLADGYFVKIENNYLIVDEFGRWYIGIKSNEGNYCILGDRQ
jgi:hypothetical protein